MSNRIINSIIILIGIFISVACDKENIPVSNSPSTSGNEDTIPFIISNLSDTYEELASYLYYKSWGPYNTHDPSIIKSGNSFYCYSTDASYGNVAPAGIQIRKSDDLIDWEFLGYAFGSIPSGGKEFIEQNGGTPLNSLWAPYIMYYNNEYRLYYSLASSVPRLSVIGLAVSHDPEGPWTERGIVVSSKDNLTIQTNAIDPSVVVDVDGKQWMYYGSAWDGIYMLQIDPSTGLAASADDIGKRIAQRGFTGSAINGNIEGPEIIYNSEHNKYYLFMAYDWLETKYNVRVGRADSPEGPFYDFNGDDLNAEQDNVPMILAPYKFQDHYGWQGVSHPSVFTDNGQYFLAHQGRPGINKYFMVLHVRKIHWTEDGWPVVSPERYAGVEQNNISTEDIAGDWEYIVFDYQVVPGYQEEQLSANYQSASIISLNSDGKINGDENGKWLFNDGLIELEWNDGKTDKVFVEYGRDWENKKETCLLFTGLNNFGTAVWGKKKE